MATKAKTTSRARSAKTSRPAAAKAASTKKTVSRTAPIAVAKVNQNKPYDVTNDLNGSEVIGEMLGTFMLVAVVTATGGNAFLVGIGLVVIASMMFAVSGAHVNPAVTFGFWVMRRISAAKMLFYWMAQFVGAILAILVSTAFSGSKLNISLNSFTQWDWYIVFAELIGTMIFMFGIAAAVNRSKSDSERGLGIGLALVLALFISTGLLQQAVTAASSKVQATSESKEAPRLTRVSGTALNPAVALSLSESDANNAMLASGSPKATMASRLTLETIVGALVGAAAGGRLYMLLTSRQRQ